MTETKVDAKRIALIGQELKDTIGAEKVKDDEVVLSTYAFDISATPFRKPSFVVFPVQRQDVIEILRIANNYKMPISVIAGGVNVTGLGIPLEGGFILDFRRMDKVIEINTDSGYAVIEPGVTFDNFTASLAEKGFRCHIPTSPGGSSPLANYMLKPSGSLCNRHLDSILDLEIILPDGTVINTGSSHFPAAGGSVRYGPFPDLAGIFCCSYGTLGVVTKAAVRIYPINESNRVNLAAFDSYKSSVNFIKDTTNHNIPESCIIWNWQFYRAFEISQSTPEIPELSLDPRKPPEGVPYNIVTTFLSGYEESVVTSEKVCEKVALKYGGRVLNRKEAEELAPAALKGWDQLYLHYRAMAPLTCFGTGLYKAWIVHVEPQVAPDLEKWAVETIYRLGVNPILYYSMPFDFDRTMFFRIFVFPEAHDQEMQEKIVTTYKTMYEESLKRYGAIPFRYRPGLPWIHQTGGYEEALKRIKKVFDPNNILGPHLGLY
jgi:FAD/FMN-containing dehydrogenase